MVKTAILNEFLDEYLNVKHISDVSCNGLQVEGPQEIHRIALVVDASLEAYKQARIKQCDMIIAHHGLIWSGIKTVSGQTFQHIKYLIQNNLCLYAAHLPLDMHREVGNNAVLADIIQLNDREKAFRYGSDDIGCFGILQKAATIDSLASLLASSIGGTPQLLPFGKKLNTTIGIVSGGGGSQLEEAISKNLDCYITGESVHQNHHQALEAGVNVIYAGHYHTETVGVKALGKTLVQRFDVATEFIDIPTLV